MCDDVTKFNFNRKRFNYNKKRKMNENHLMQLIAELSRNLKQNTNILLQMKTSLSNLSIYQEEIENDENVSPEHYHDIEHDTKHVPSHIEHSEEETIQRTEKVFVSFFYFRLNCK